MFVVSTFQRTCSRSGTRAKMSRLISGRTLATPLVVVTASKVRNHSVRIRIKTHPRPVQNFLCRPYWSILIKREVQAYFLEALMRAISKERVILRATILVFFLLIWYCDSRGMLPENGRTILTILLFGIFWFIEARFIKPTRTDQSVPRKPRL